MPNRFGLPLLMSAALLVGCAGSFQYKPRTLSPAHWEASNVSVAIDAQRKAASTQLPRVPVVTLGGGQEDDLRLPVPLPDSIGHTNRPRDDEAIAELFSDGGALSALPPASGDADERGRSEQREQDRLLRCVEAARQTEGGIAIFGIPELQQARDDLQRVLPPSVFSAAVIQRP